MPPQQQQEPTHDEASPPSMPASQRPALTRMESVRSTASSRRPRHNKRRRSTVGQRCLGTGRTGLMVCFVGLAAVAGWVTHHAAQRQVADAFWTGLRANGRVLHHPAGRVLAAAATLPITTTTTTSWPVVPNWEGLTEALLELPAVDRLDVVPVVPRSKAAAFDAFADEYYYHHDDIHQDLQLLAGSNSTVTNHEIESHSNGWLFPMAQSTGPRLDNFYVGPARQAAVDALVACVDDDDALSADCAVVSSIVNVDVYNDGDDDGATTTNQAPQESSLGTLILVPILVPAAETRTLAGLVSTTVLLDKVLGHLFSLETNDNDDSAPIIRGLDCVFTVHGRSVTYTIRDGVPELVSDDADLHNPRYDDYRWSIPLFGGAATNDSDQPPAVDIYPNDSFFASAHYYRNNNTTRHPTLAVAVIVSLILAMALAFGLYDFFVRREFTAKKELLQAKRQFMRFVSHEVRTPLNSVFMGLQLMKSELASCLDQDLTRFMMKTENSNKSLSAASTERQHHSRRHHHHHNHHSDSSDDDDDDDEHDHSVSHSHDEIDYATKYSLCDNELLPSEQQAPPEVARRRSSGWGTGTNLTLEWFLLTQEIQANVQGAVDVLNDLLNYDKIEQSSLRLDLTLFNIWKVIEQSFNEFNLPAKQKKLNYELLFYSVEKGLSTHVKRDTGSLPHDMQHVRLLGDSIRISQVLRNLISNGLKFTPEEGTLQVFVRWIPEVPCMESRDEEAVADKDALSPLEEVKVNGDETVQARKAGQLELCVEDSGAGMTRLQLSKLFADGMQFNANQLQAGQGSGLGLYIAKGIVEEHGGTLTASSAGLGRGTTFTMTLPLWSKCSVDSIDTYSLSSSSSESVDEKDTCFHILVVDDVKSNRKLLSRLLRNEGHTCDEAENGQEAVDKFRAARAAKDPYDAVVMDYEMPVMIGPEAAKIIREMDKEVNIVGVTGNVLPDDIRYFKACGANGVLPKPLKLVDLEAYWHETGLLT